MGVQIIVKLCKCTSSSYSANDCFLAGEKFKYGTTFGSSTARVGVPQVQV